MKGMPTYVILQRVMPQARDPEKNRQNTKAQRKKEKLFIEAMTKLYGEAPVDPLDKIAKDVIRLGEANPNKRRGRKPQGNIPSALRKRVVELYLDELPVGVIAAKTGLFVETVQGVLQIRNESCIKCGFLKLGNTSLVEGVIPLCRTCRRAVKI